jgi:anti-sigma B factor antagonist
MKGAGISLERTETGVAVVVLQGDHDLSTAAALRGRLESLIAEGVPVVVDLTPTTFIDSAILDALLSALRRAREQGLGFAALIGEQAAEPAVRRIFELTQLVPLFPVLSSRSEALSAVLAEPDGR